MSLSVHVVHFDDDRKMTLLDTWFVETISGRLANIQAAGFSSGSRLAGR